MLEDGTRSNETTLLPSNGWLIVPQLLTQLSVMVWLKSRTERGTGGHFSTTTKLKERQRSGLQATFTSTSVTRATWTKTPITKFSWQITLGTQWSTVANHHGSELLVLNLFGFLTDSQQWPLTNTTFLLKRLLNSSQNMIGTWRLWQSRMILAYMHESNRSIKKNKSRDQI